MRDFAHYALLFIIAVIFTAIFVILITWARSFIPDMSIVIDYEIRLTQVANCQADEQFTLDQCIMLVGD